MCRLVGVQIAPECVLAGVQRRGSTACAAACRVVFAAERRRDADPLPGFQVEEAGRQGSLTRIHNLDTQRWNDKR